MPSTLIIGRVAILFLFFLLQEVLSLQIKCLHLVKNKLKLWLKSYESGLFGTKIRLLSQEIGFLPLKLAIS